MKIKISGGSYWFRTYFFELQFELNGSGTIDDPFLITNNQNIDDNDLEYSIYDSSAYIKFENILFESLNLTRCQNVIILDTELKNLNLNRCSKILIQNVEVKKNLSIFDSYVIKFADCNIHKMLGFSGDQILFSNCSIKRISRKTEASVLVEHSMPNKIRRKYLKNIHGKDFSIEKT
ncbi:MAG: hypothetical protein ACFE9S_03345 [Candidatus Hermodarchaeota archaeon]